MIDQVFSDATKFQEAGDWPKAKAVCEFLLTVAPDHAQALNLLGSIYLREGNTQKAAELLSRAVQKDPAFAIAHGNLGTALQILNHPAKALDCFNRALELKPSMAVAHANKGNLLQKLGQIDAALSSYTQANTLDPDYAPAFVNKGLLQIKLGRFNEAVHSLKKALSINPNIPSAWLNKGVALQELGQIDEAIDCYNQVIKQEPSTAQAYMNKSLCLLLSGRYLEGWELHEWRWKTAQSKASGLSKTFSQPLWVGQHSLNGKTILLHCEQGLGDTIQFCRFIPMVKSLGATVILEAPKELGSLLAGIGADQVVIRGEKLPDFDHHCPLLSLPFALKTTLDNIPCHGPYLQAEDSKLVEWEKLLGERIKPRIGLVWSGNPDHGRDAYRSIPLALFAGLPDGFDYFCLQKDIRENDRTQLQSMSIKDCSDLLKDFSDTAAACEMMDLVISVDTSVAHLSAALGKPTWVLVEKVPDWRWLLNRPDSPWYSSVTIHRQSQAGDWVPVLRTLSEELASYGAQPRHGCHQETHT